MIVIKIITTMIIIISSSIIIIVIPIVLVRKLTKVMLCKFGYG